MDFWKDSLASAWSIELFGYRKLAGSRSWSRHYRMGPRDLPRLQSQSAAAARRKCRRKSHAGDGACVLRLLDRVGTPRSWTIRISKRTVCSMLVQLKCEVGTLVVQTTAAITGKVLTTEDQQRLAEETVRELRTRAMPYTIIVASPASDSAAEMGALQERITSTKKGSITSFQAVYVPADDLTDPAPATTFAHLDATIVLERAIAELGIYPAVDPLASTSRALEAEIATSAGGAATLQGSARHHRDPRHG